MANQQPDLSSQSIDKAEHIDPATTGDNIAARKVANYVWDGVSAWTRMTSSGGGGGGTTNSSNTVDATPATQNITTQDLVSSTATGANNQSIITGAPTAGSAASFTLAGYDTVIAQVTGTWTGTLQSEISQDGGTTWYLRGIHQAGTSYTAVTFTANFAGGLNIGGYTNFRLRATAAMTGTAVVKVTESVNPNSVYLANAVKIADATVPSQQLAITSAGAMVVDDLAAAPTGAAVPANAQYQGNLAQTALPTAATAGNLVGQLSDKFGRSINIAQAPRDLISVSNATCTATVSPVTLIAAAGAGIFTDVVDVRLVNTSATGTEVDISDGTNTYYYYAPPTDMRGIVISVPDPATTANTAWTITTISSVTSVKATVKYIKNK